jgi:integrase/recombinase XerD
VRLPRRLPRSVTADELRLLLSAISRRRPAFSALLLRLTVILLFTTGLRIGELAAVRLSDIDWNDGIIQVRGKGNRERRVYLVGEEVRILLTRYFKARQRIAVTDALLVNQRGRAATPQYLRRRLRESAEDAELCRRVTPHMLRHAAATHLIEAGVDIRFVQKLLGHASIATTQMYTHVSDVSLQRTLARADTLKRVWTQKRATRSGTIAMVKSP